jgi:hypothetical protein
MSSIGGWREVYWGGSPEAEQRHFADLAAGILEVQANNRERAGTEETMRAFHAKAIVSTTDAEFRFSDDLPPEFRAQFAAPGAAYPATVRISNAAGTRQPDRKRDLRGIAVRVQVSEDEFRDFLATNYPVPHARDGDQFIAFALATSGSPLLAVPRLVQAVGPLEAARMLANVAKASSRKVRSVALETFWSRGAMLWADAGPVRYSFRPAPDAVPAGDPARNDADYLEHSPIEEAAHEWSETESPPIVVARLTLRRQNIYEPEARASARVIEAMSFSPWHTTDEFRPLGNINRARKPVYEAGAGNRRASTFTHP